MKKLFLMLCGLLMVAVVSAQTRTVSGTVVAAADNEPLIGATVVPVGGGSGTATDIDGKFHITVPGSVKEVKVSYVGMKTVTLPLTDGMVVKLEMSDNRLDEVIVTGYGTGKNSARL